MKKIVASLIMVIGILFASIATASETELSIRQDNYSNEHFDSGNSVVLKLLNDKGYYGFIGAGATSYKYGSQQLANINIYSIGIGVKKEVVNDISLFAHIGWYQPEASGLNKGSSFEAMGYLASDRVYMNEVDFQDKRYNPFRWPHREFSVGGNVGGEIGIDIKHNFTEKISMSLSTSYRILELWHETKFWDEEFMEKTGGYWIFEEHVDYSGVSIGLAFSYKW